MDSITFCIFVAVLLTYNNDIMRKGYVFLLVISLTALIGCDSGIKEQRRYSIEHYLDTIDGHKILTTVCFTDDHSEVSVSTLSLGNVDSVKTNFK